MQIEMEYKEAEQYLKKQRQKLEEERMQAEYNDEDSDKSDLKQFIDEYEGKSTGQLSQDINKNDEIEKEVKPKNVS